MSKKILSVVLALALVLTTFAVSAFAFEKTDFEKEGSTYKQTWALSEAVDKGDNTWSVDVSLTADYTVGAISFQVTNPEAKNGVMTNAKLTNVVKGTALAYEANIKWNETTGVVAIVPEAITEDDEGVNLSSGAVIATLTFTLTGTSETIAIINNPKTEDNLNGDLIAARLSDNKLATSTMICGQTVVSVGESRVLGGAVAEPPTLAVVDGTIGVINTDETVMDSTLGLECTGYIYGVEVDQEQIINDVFEVIGDGEIEIIANEAGSEAGTGTIVNVLDSDGTVVETYVLIIFGDVNGDGYVDASDAGDIELHDATMWGYDLETEEDVFGYCGNLPEYMSFAGDVNRDGAADPTDAGDVELHDATLWGYDLETEEDVFGYEGRFTQEYIISLF